MEARMRLPNNYWTLERCAAVARKYKTKTDFSRDHRSVYTTTHRNGWLDQICAHMTPLRKPHGYWTKARCTKAAKKFKTRHEFQKGDISAYITAQRSGWLDDVCSHMGESRHNGYWTREKISAAARCFESRWAFNLGNQGAYMAARRQNILDEVCAHMRERGNMKQRFVYVIRNRTLNIGYIGLAIDPQERYEQHKKSGRHASLFESEHELVVVSKLLSAEAASKLERKLIKQYRADEWTLLNRKAGGGLGGGHTIWTKERVFECGRQCATRTEFEKRFQTARSTAQRNGWTDEIFANHPLQGFQHQWSLDRHNNARKGQTAHQPVKRTPKSG
jgi:predicted GIY-YIG superfamily endonuclease